MYVKCSFSLQWSSNLKINKTNFDKVTLRGVFFFGQPTLGVGDFCLTDTTLIFCFKKKNHFDLIKRLIVSPKKKKNNNNNNNKRLKLLTFCKLDKKYICIYIFLILDKNIRFLLW